MRVLAGVVLMSLVHGESAVTDVAADADVNQAQASGVEAFSLEDPGVQGSAANVSSESAAAAVVVVDSGDGQQPFVVEDMDYPGADAGVLVDMPRAAVGTLPGYDVEIIRRNEAEDAWPVQEMAPYYEWAVAQLRGNRYALPEPDVQQLERLNQILHDTVAELRRLGDADVASAADTSLDAIAGAPVNGLTLDSESLNNLITTVSGSLSHVAQAAGQVVGVTTTQAAPVNQAVLGLLNILQGFQKLAIAVGSIPLSTDTQV
ncbi:hypothetical protein GNI_067230 [Gregarina niphandrodes]|uniref:Transmembrane protein n=1 Tax=Gregarina niphandrodes TaxID=110365 RepID=A0A023B7P8_GRENI|nr:hypothetical protein GNI_067230 [Gregarina niphandrodes]EZG67627.1 hypothetical protein GNI_067230 [Gregarina niphandrodes]|eukprot:XP_011130180.1 hypothetical protein GNI_067230 [Gregarina niphandrodes]